MSAVLSATLWKIIILSLTGFASLCRLTPQIEIIITAVLLSQGGSLTALRSLKTLRVLKSFRVLRLLKMFRYLDSLRKLGEVLFKSMNSFVSIGVLTLLFAVVFSIMGLHVYGEYSPDIGYPNFHTFLNSCVLIFQVPHPPRMLPSLTMPRRGL